MRLDGGVGSLPVLGSHALTALLYLTETPCLPDPALCKELQLAMYARFSDRKETWARGVWKMFSCGHKPSSRIMTPNSWKLRIHGNLVVWTTCESGPGSENARLD